MPSVQWNRASCRESSRKLLPTMQAGSFMFLLFLNVENLVEGFDFCFDGSKESRFTCLLCPIIHIKFKYTINVF